MTPPQTHQRYDDTNQPSTQQRPGLSRQEDHQVAQSNYLKEAAVMTNSTVTSSKPRTSGLTLDELQALAKSMSIDIDPLDVPVEDLWAEYTMFDRTIRLHPQLGPPQRRCALAEMIAHARLMDVNHRRGDDATAMQMAARMLITPEDWKTISPIWEECKDDEPQRIFRKFGILPSFVAAYEQTEEVWHPDGCVNWFALCGTGTEDDIHGFIPETIKAGDATVHAPQMVVGSPNGKYPVESAITVEVDGALQYGNVVSFEASPAEARKLAWFLLEQAEAAEFGARNSDEISDPPSVTTPELVSAGGGR